MLAAAGTVAAKDLRLFLRDRVALLLGFALPVLLATVFAAAIGGMGGGDGVGRVELLVEDLDGSEGSRALVEALGDSPALEVELAGDVRARVARGKAPAALLLPSGFGADVAAGRRPRLVLYRDPGKVVEQQLLAGALVPALFRAAGPALGRAALEQGMQAMGFPAGWRAQAERAFTAGDGAEGGVPPDFGRRLPELLGLEVEDVAGGRDATQRSAAQSHAVAGIAVMMLLFGLVACGGTILEEEQAGTLQRVRLTPHAGRAVLLGKLGFTMLVGLVQLALLFAYGALVFDVPILRSPLALVAHSVALAWAAAGFGLLLAVACRTRKQLEGVSTLLILAMSSLGGSWFPLAFVPDWFRTLGHFTLNAWAMDGYQGIFWYGEGLAGIAPEVGVLLAIGAVLLLGAHAVWKRRFELSA